MAGSDRLVIVFSHINEKPGRFSFYGTFRDIAVNKLFVNTPANRWYQDGIPGIGDWIEAAADGIRIIMQEIAPRSVMCIGNSMGAYAALLFGTLVNADHVLAIGPETLLRLARQPEPGLYRQPAADTGFDDLLPYLSLPAAGPEDRHHHRRIRSGRCPLRPAHRSSGRACKSAACAASGMRCRRCSTASKPGGR